MVGQEHITETLRRQVASGRTSHAYLFVGTRGTGKTTCAKILSRALNCEHPVNGDPCNACASCEGIESGAVLDVVEIDAASNNGVDNIRAIRDEAVYTPASVKKRVYIIDEVHMLSTSAFNALLKILEEPPEHLVFILATTELNKVPATILSRCQHFSFRRIMPENIAKRLQYVASCENFTLTDGAAALLSRLADGSMRDALSLLDQCVSSDTVDEDAVMNAVGLMGTANTAELWRDLAGNDLPAALALFEKIYYGGADPASVLADLLSLLRDMLMVRVAPKGSQGLLSGAFDAGRLTELAGSLPAERLLAASETLQSAIDSLKDVRDKRTKTELCLIKLTGLLSGSYAEPTAPAPAHPAAPAPKPAPQPKPAPKPEAAPPPWEDIPPEPANPDAPPPWDDEDAPPEDFVDWDALQPSEPEPTPKPERTPSPAPAPAPVAAASDAWWADTLKQCAGQVDENAFRFLSDRANLVPELAGSTLTLRAKNEFVRMMVDSAALKSAVAQAATAVLGKSVTVSIATGIPAAPTGGHDKLDDLARFGDIVKYK